MVLERKRDYRFSRRTSLLFMWPLIPYVYWKIKTKSLSIQSSVFSGDEYGPYEYSNAPIAWICDGKFRTCIVARLCEPIGFREVWVRNKVKIVELFWVQVSSFVLKRLPRWFDPGSSWVPYLINMAEISITKSERFATQLALVVAGILMNREDVFV